MAHTFVLESPGSDSIMIHTRVKVFQNDNKKEHEKRSGWKKVALQNYCDACPQKATTVKQKRSCDHKQLKSNDSEQSKILNMEPENVQFSNCN